MSFLLLKQTSVQAHSRNGILAQTFTKSPPHSRLVCGFTYLLICGGVYSPREST